MGKLFVGNLPYSVTDDSLKSEFEKVGEVTSAKIILDRDTGRSRGFGFVEMDEAEKAIQELNDFEIGDPPRKMRVSIAREREGRR